MYFSGLEDDLRNTVLSAFNSSSIKVYVKIVISCTPIFKIMMENKHIFKPDLKVDESCFEEEEIFIILNLSGC